MREYGKIHRSFWTNPALRAAGRDARELAAYLLTGPHTTMLGCFRLPDAYVAEDLGWDVEGVRLAFGALADIGFAVRDDETKWLVIPRFLKWNRPENPNQVKGILKAFAAVPAFEYVGLLVVAIEEFVGVKVTPPKGSPNGSGKGSVTVTEPSRAPSRGFRNHDPDARNGIETKEQEQDQKQEQKGSAEPTQPPQPHPTSARDGTTDETEWLPPEQTTILAELRRHPILEPIATARFAGTLSGRSMSSGRPIAWGLAAIADAAADASEEGLNAGGLAKKVRSYWDNAKRPRDVDSTPIANDTAPAAREALPAWVTSPTPEREATEDELRETALAAQRAGMPVPAALKRYLPPSEVA